MPFWEATLGWTAHRINDQFVALRAPADEAIGFDILFQKVPEPKVAKNRAHIDFDAEDLEAGASRSDDRSRRQRRGAVIAGPSRP